MTDPQYADPRLAGLYDQMNAGDRDLVFYEARLGAAPLRILDLGCGTGAFAVRLAAAGHQVTGVDPAPAMLDVARARLGGDRVAWLQGEASDLPPSMAFDVVVMTGHAFQCLLTDESVQATLAAVRARLASAGRFMFETRNPAARAWEAWTPDHVRSVGGVEVFHAILAVEGDRVSFQTHYRFGPDDVRVSASTLRFPAQPALAEHLRRAGYGEVAWFGDWDGSAVCAESPEMIAVAVASD